MRKRKRKKPRRIRSKAVRDLIKAEEGSVIGAGPRAKRKRPWQKVVDELERKGVGVEVIGRPPKKLPCRNCDDQTDLMNWFRLVVIYKNKKDLKRAVVEGIFGKNKLFRKLRACSQIEEELKKKYPHPH